MLLVASVAATTRRAVSDAVGAEAVETELLLLGDGEALVVAGDLGAGMGSVVIGGAVDARAVDVLAVGLALL
jgi:hypothetical protein